MPYLESKLAVLAVNSLTQVEKTSLISHLLDYVSGGDDGCRLKVTVR